MGVFPKHRIAFRAAPAREGRIDLAPSSATSASVCAAWELFARVLNQVALDTSAAVERNLIEIAHLGLCRVLNTSPESRSWGSWTLKVNLATNRE